VAHMWRMLYSCKDHINRDDLNGLYNPVNTVKISNINTQISGIIYSQWAFASHTVCTFNVFCTVQYGSIVWIINVFKAAFI